MRFRTCYLPCLGGGESSPLLNGAMTDSVREESNPGSCDPLVPESSVSRFLSENERFARQWFLEHATPDMVSEWLAGRGYCPELEMPDPVASLSDSYARATQSGRNSVTSELFQDMLMCPKKKSPAAHTLSRQELQQHLRSLQEPELLMELIRDIANELDVDTLCHKILVNVSLLTQSDRGSLFLAKGPRGGARHLVAKLFDVTPDSVLQDALDAAGGESRIPPIPFGVGIAGHVALTKENLNIKDAYQDSRFNKEIDARTGYRTVSVMCQPILNFRGDVIGVAQCINKVAGGQHFTEQDQEVFRKYLTFCGIGVQNAQLFEMSVREFKRNQLLLSLAKSIFEESSSLERLIGRIMVKAEGLLQCEKCRVYLVDTEQHDEQIFYQRLDSSCDEKSSPLPPIFKPKKFSKPQDVIFATIFELRRDEQEIRQPSLKDLTGSEAVHVHFARHVAATEQTFNWSGTNEEIKSARSNNLSAVPNDIPAEKLGHRVLSIPIFNSDNKVIGVAQLVNKLKGQVFTECDISTLEAFSIFCGLGIYNTQMYENASKLMAKQKVALEVLSYHASSSLEETKRLMQISIPSAEKFKLYSFEFSDFRLSDDDTCQAAIRMFMDLDLIHKFHIPYQVMCRWILSVKKNYRPVIYHNWRHALNVAQTVFAMLMTGHMKEMMSDIEMMALLVACLSHDLDHRGTNNSFQTKIESPLAILYSTSTMEHHHFDQCIMILNSEGNNIFQFLSPEEYRSIISIVESAILSTDLALYFKKKDPFLRLLKSGQPDWKNPLHKELLRGMMMTACDVSAICKPWEVQKKVAELVAGEFFQQGDLEKERLKEQPIAMMDREKKDELPAMQVGFIDCVCLPVYEALTVVQPALSPLLHGCLQNRRNWKELVHDQQIEREDGLPPTIRSKRLESNTLNGVVRLQHLSFQTQVVCKASEDRRKKISLEHCRMKRSSKHHQEGVCTVL